MNKTTIATLGVICVLAFIFAPTANAQVDINLNSRLLQAPIIVNHSHIDLIDQIPSVYIERAKNIRMIFGNRSVGFNTDSALNCTSWESDEICYANRPACGYSCIKTEHEVPQFNSPSQSVNWNYPGGYTRNNWIHESWADTWQNMVNGYVKLLDNNQLQGGQNLNNFDVFSFHFSYLNVSAGNTIADQSGGFFSNNPPNEPHWTYDDVFDLEQRLVQHNSKYFIYFSSSLSRDSGSVATNFNNQMRQFVQQKDSRGRYRIFLDFADIEAHDPWGNPCYDLRDGVQYCRASGECENEPNDGVNHPAICQHYTPEIYGGHFGSGSINIRMSKAIWVLMAQLAGWTPGNSSTPVPTPVPTLTPTPTPTLLPTATPTPSATPTPKTGDANGDGKVDGVDYVIWLNNYGRINPTGPSQGDFNSDSKVDGVDYVIWLNNYGS